MGTGARLVDFDDLFRKATRIPYIINDVEAELEEDVGRLNEMIYTKYTEGVAANLPSCECGTLMGGFYLNKDGGPGVKCSKCNTRVTAPGEAALEPLLWIRAPKIENGSLKLMSPLVWTQLAKHFTISRFNVIRYLCDTNYPEPHNKVTLMRAIDSLNLTRGYLNFINNFDEIMEKLFSLPQFSKGPSKKAPAFELKYYLKRNRNKIFCDYLPMPNKSLLVLEENSMGKWVDPTIVAAIDAIRSITSIDAEGKNFSTRRKENRTVAAIDQLSKYFVGIYKEFLAKKEGIFRRQLYGTRCHFSARGVIGSITEPHEQDEIELPWAMGLALFRDHLYNKLFRRGFTQNSALTLINAHSHTFHPLLAELLQELIDESPPHENPFYPEGRRGIPNVLQRNPSLERGSAQALYITKFNHDVTVRTIRISILIVNSFGADFDGKLLPSLNFFNCWKLLRAIWTTASRQDKATV